MAHPAGVAGHGASRIRSLERTPGIYFGFGASGLLSGSNFQRIGFELAWLNLLGTYVRAIRLRTLSTSDLRRRLLLINGQHRILKGSRLIWRGVGVFIPLLNALRSQSLIGRIARDRAGPWRRVISESKRFARDIAYRAAPGSGSEKSIGIRISESIAVARVSSDVIQCPQPWFE